MDFGLTEWEKKFQQEVRDFIKENLTPDMVYDAGLQDTPERQAFISKIGEKGWLKIGFPKEYGGDGVDNPTAKYILNTELLRAGGPIVGKNLGQICGTLMMFGGEHLKQEFIARTLANEIQWAIVYSEPGAGSDLAAMSCKAEIDGDDFIINGEKRWITSAHYGDYFWTAVRTDPKASKHKGISLIIIDHDAPGITLQPTIMLGSDGGSNAGVHRTNSVFFDNVRVPRSRLIGEMNKGFNYMMHALNLERFLMFGVMNEWRHYEALLGWVKKQKGEDGKPLLEDPLVRHRLARLDLAMEAARALDLRCCAKAASDEGTTPAVEAFMTKVQFTIAYTELAQVAMDLIGPDATIMLGDEVVLDGIAAAMYYQYGHQRIAAGGCDVAKNQIAKQLFPLPPSF